MASSPVVATVIQPAERRVVRLSGSGHCPRWRGRVHLVALVVSLPAGAALLVHRPAVTTALYLVGLLAMYSVSSAYHLLPLSPAARKVLRRADHATIYICIAASYTPLCAVAVPAPVGPLLLVAAWAGAALGVVLKVTQFDRRPIVGSAGYFVLGWMAIGVLPQLVGRLGPTQMTLLLGSGVAYTLGALVLFARWPDPDPDRFGYHELWHLAVVLASASYFGLVWLLPPGAA